MAKREAIEQWSHLSCVDHPELDGREEEFLIRSDMAHLLILLEVRRGRVDEPIAHRPWVNLLWKCDQMTMRSDQC